MDGAIELRPGRRGHLEIAIETGLSGLFERPSPVAKWLR